MRAVTRTLVALTAAAALAVTPLSAAVAATSARTVPTDPKTLASAYLTDAQVKALLGVPAMVKLSAPVSTVKNGVFSGLAKNSPLGPRYSAFSTKYEGPFIYAQSMITFAGDDTATKAEFEKIRNNTAFANRVIKNTATETLTYTGPTNQKTTEKRVMTAWVFKDGMIAGGECLTLKPTVTEKALAACATKTANAQWAKAAKAVK